MPAGRPSCLFHDVIVIDLVDWSYKVRRHTSLNLIAKEIGCTYLALYRVFERLKGFLITPSRAVLPFALFGHLGFDAEIGIVNVQYRAELLKAIHTRKKEKN